MSFVKALASVAVGFAAAKGMDKYQEMGGMAGLQNMLKDVGGGDMANQIGKLADQFGVPDGGARVQEMMGQFGLGGTGGNDAAMAGLGGLMASMRGAAETGTKQTADMMEAVFGQTPVGDAMEQQAKLMIRAMIQAAKADGEIDPAEQAAIIERLGDVGEEELEYIRTELQAPLDLAGLVQDSAHVGREQVYSTSLAAIRVDHPAEAQYLRQLASGLGLDDAERDAIHARMGVAPLA
ncbi:MAG: DUF533 domain-containing protein [Roseobacter sp.]